MKMKRIVAVLLILCLVICGMTACKSEDKKKTAVAGGYVEGAPENEGENFEIIDNQGGGTRVDREEDTDLNSEPDDGDDKEPADNGNTEPDNGKTDTNTNPDKNNDNTDPNEGTDKEETPNQTPDEGNDEGDDEDDVDYKEGNKIKILDYNLRYTDDPEGSIQERSVRLREVMKKYTPDICGFQEIVPEWVTYLDADYPTYGYHVQFRAQNSKEGTMVMWNTDTMEEIESGHFWLSPTPDVESSGDAAWGKSGFFRIVTWAKVRVKATGSEFVFFATHQNSAGTHPENSGKTIVNYARKFGVGTKFGGFCMGDYNVGPWSDGYMAMLEGNIFSDINDDLEQSNATTVNGYHTGSSTNIIDFVFYTPDKVHPIHYEVVDMEVDGGYVSDHRGIYAEAALLY